MIKFRPDALCPKCAFPLMQMYRQFHNGSHPIIVDKDVKTCNNKGEHLHMECCCGYEMTLRPLDWGLGLTKVKAKKVTKRCIISFLILKTYTAIFQVLIGVVKVKEVIKKLLKMNLEN